MQEQTIIAISGRKQAGKNTCYGCLQLWRPEAQEFSFADSLKRVCVDVLGLEDWQAYGSDAEKNSLVPHLLWENFPVETLCDNGTYTGEPFKGETAWWHDQWNTPFKINAKTGMALWPKKGPMTAREVLQYWGTDIFRKQYHEVWTEACLRKIRKIQCKLAVITDCRFPNEVAAVQAAGGKVIRLTRNIFPDDKHPSETALDANVFDHSRFDAILDNANLALNEQCEEIYGIMKRWNIVSPKSVQRIHV